MRPINNLPLSIGRTANLFGNHWRKFHLKYKAIGIPGISLTSEISPKWQWLNKFHFLETHNPNNYWWNVGRFWVEEKWCQRKTKIGFIVYCIVVFQSFADRWTKDTAIWQGFTKSNFTKIESCQWRWCWQQHKLNLLLVTDQGQLKAILITNETMRQTITSGPHSYL